MKSELEALIEAYDAARQASGSEGSRLKAIFQSRLSDELEKHPNLDQATLQRVVHAAWRHWLAAQKKFPSIPPKA